MPFVFGMFTGVGAGYLSGSIKIADEDVTNIRQLHWPSGINALARFGSGFTYGNRHYMVGAWSSNLALDENFRVLRQGIVPPQAPPTVSAGGGATEQIGYLSFYDILTDERSSLSEGTSFTGNVTRSWTNIPTSVPMEAAVIEGTATFAGTTVTGTDSNFAQLRPGDKIAKSTDLTRWAVIRTITSDTSMTIDDGAIVGTGVTLVHKPVSRCSHVELWVAVSGTLPRLAARIPLGVVSFTEAVPTLSLGEAFLDNFEPMPFGTINTSYADRQLLAGNPRNPDTLYLSALFAPERWEGLSFKTRYAEPITGLVRMRDYVLVLCPESSYILQGYTENDLKLDVSAPDLGGLGHVTNLVVRDVAWIPNNKGYWMFNGAWHQMMGDNLNAWIYMFKRNRRRFEMGITGHDPENHMFYFIPNYEQDEEYIVTGWDLDENIIWGCDYDPIQGVEAGGFSQPNWEWDYPTEPTGENTLIAAYLAPTTSSVGKFYRIDRTGIVQVEDVDGINAQNIELATAHLFMGDHGGDVQEGKTLHKTWFYTYLDFSRLTVLVYGGDEYARGREDVARHPFGTNMPIDPSPALVVGPTEEHRTAPDVPNGAADGIWQAETVHTWVQEVVGRGFTYLLVWDSNPRYVEFYGLGGYYGPGPKQRLFEYSTGV